MNTHSFDPRNSQATMRVNNEILTLISLSARDLAEGQSTRELPCPFCNGGRSNETAFVITKAGPDVLFICHRASCGQGGAIDPSGALIRGAPRAQPTQTKEAPRTYTGPLKDLLPWQAQMLFKSYGLGKEDVERGGIRGVEDANRLALPVRARTGVLRGYMLRAINNWGMKWDSWQTLINAPWMGWYLPQQAHPKTLVLLEDQYSAIKVSRQYPSVALLGTNFNLPKVMEISDAKYERYVLALDKDAYAKSLVQADKWKFYFDGNFSVAMLSKDMKYLSDTDIQYTIEESFK